VSVASAIGPLAGGALIAGFGVHSGWRAVFYVNVPIGLVLIPLAVRLLPRHVPVPGARAGLDLPGAGLLGLAIALILLPFIQGGWGSGRWWLLPGAAAVLTVFVRWEGRATVTRAHRPGGHTPTSTRPSWSSALTTPAR
jgi:MFS family permease